MWKSAPQIDAILKSLQRVSTLHTLYSLSIFWRDAVYTRNYSASQEWKSIVVLSSYGEAVLNDLARELHDLPEPDVQLAYFGTFSHHELFFDFDATDATKIRLIFEQELRRGDLRLPFRFGRVLYDRFNDTYADTRTDHVMSQNAEVLLQGTPVGVYQAGTLVSGPLGLLDSQETRWMPPSNALPLWHCSDTGCSALHRVKLLPPSIPLVDAFSRIQKGLYARMGPPSEWQKALPISASPSPTNSNGE